MAEFKDCKIIGVRVVDPYAPKEPVKPLDEIKKEITPLVKQHNNIVKGRFRLDKKNKTFGLTAHQNKLEEAKEFAAMLKRTIADNYDVHVFVDVEEEKFGTVTSGTHSATVFRGEEVENTFEVGDIVWVSFPNEARADRAGVVKAANPGCYIQVETKDEDCSTSIYVPGLRPSQLRPAFPSEFLSQPKWLQDWYIANAPDSHKEDDYYSF